MVLKKMKIKIFNSTHTDLLEKELNVFLQSGMPIEIAFFTNAYQYDAGGENRHVITLFYY